MKHVGIALLVLAVICLFVAFERYQTNANNVKAMNQLSGGMLPGLSGGTLKPATPAITKYALLGAVILGAGGGYCLMNAKPQK